ncbi:twin-arginine translocase subunit TatB [Pseudaminobacter sp. 19-2017]|uniref:Sec-independent protein translocase protein TatB n=1 Tax=Pseudaminobacter soli (ex Zhang et al. 2022) TaxID=2831468 RepID=A0A942I1A7_9HYPH|nr:Sec-independent protein translocase protein TatB [Pseudaminobacter soli]MBS3647477.1 twin-arginine translocase subunit TatB [Pseudaminobacter soli]
MLDVGWTEMLVIAVVMIVVVGPKDLPKMLRTFGKMTAKMRTMAGDFQKQFNEALKEAELDEVKKSVDTLRDLNPANQIKQQLNPFEKAAADVRAGLQSLNPTKSAAPADPAATTAQPAEPLKNGATEMPGVNGPDKMPEPPSQGLTASQATPAQTVATPAPSPEPAKAGAPATPNPAPVKAPRTRKSAAAKPAEPAGAKAAKPAGTKTAKPASSATPRRKSSPKSAPASEADSANMNGTGADNGASPGKST